MDCKATGNIGAFARGGYPRGAPKASAHDLGGKEKYIPCGIVDEAPAQRSVPFGRSSKTSAVIVDTLAAGWQRRSATEQSARDGVQINMDNGSESRGVRTQFLQRLVQFVDTIGKPLRSRCGMTRPLPARTIRVSAGGGLWHGSGMAPS
jgi:hypothetical protein